MNSNLKKMTKEWMQLERKTFQQRKIAEEFYENNLMQLIEKDFLKRNNSKVIEKVKYLVMSVGTSYEPLVLNISLFRPEKILFLYTEKSEEILDKIVNYSQLKPKNYEKRKVNETNPLDIYREIKNIYLEWKKPEKLYIDFTGGTKAMSAASAMAGALIDVQLVYVGTNQYMVDFRKPEPGSEMLFFIDNPLTVFGDLEIEKAMTLFERYNYASAKERLMSLKENVPEPNTRQQLEFVYLLSKCYEAWDALDFIDAYNAMTELTEKMARDQRLHDDFWLMDNMQQLRIQKNILEELKIIPSIIRARENKKILQNKNCMVALMFTMYQNAMVREKQEKYDMATLLLYRLLEMIEQRRLAGYNLYVSQMDYINLDYKKSANEELNKLEKEHGLSELKRQVMKIKMEVFGKAGNGYLQDQVSLLDGFILLLALHDKISMTNSGKYTDKIKRIRSMVYLRNNSIFAHGLGPVGIEDFRKFKEFVVEIFKEFCAIEKIPFEAYRVNIEWINPMNSVHYLKMEGE